MQTGVFPLYEIENGKYKMSVNTPRRRPVQDYLKLQGRFRHLSEDNVQIIQDRVDKEYAHITDMVARDKAPAAST